VFTDDYSSESVTNNRIKSGYENRQRAPIDLVPSAGSRTGTADGQEVSEPGIANVDAQLEEGESIPASSVSSPNQSTTQFLTPQSQIPHLRV